MRLEHRCSRDSDGGDPHVPEALGIGLALDQHGISGSPDLLQLPLAVQTDLASRSPFPLQLLVRISLPERDLAATLVQVRLYQILRAVPVLVGAELALALQPVLRQVLFCSVLRKRVRPPVYLPFRFLVDTVFLQDLLVGLLGVDVVDLRVEADEVASDVLRMAVPLSGLQVNRKAAVVVIVEWAESCQVIAAEFRLFHISPVLGFVIDNAVDVYLCHAHALTPFT